jgi:hypothetical protein
MRQAILPAVGAAAIVALAAPGAHACGRGGGYPSGGLVLALGAGAIGIGAIDIGLTVYDLPSILTAQPRSAGYGVFEVLFGGAQLALGVAAMSSSNASGFWTGYTIWMGALTMHGIWSIAASMRAGPEGGAPPLEPPPRDSQLPLKISIGPTYAPVGQLAHPGFGLVGRF